MTEKEKFENWLKEAKMNGLTNLHFSFNYEKILNKGYTEEDIYRFMNESLAAPKKIVENIDDDY